MGSRRGKPLQILETSATNPAGISVCARQTKNDLEIQPHSSNLNLRPTTCSENGRNAFTLTRIAGHSTITITQCYCVPQANTVESAFRNAIRWEQNWINSTIPDKERKWRKRRA